MNSVMMKDTSHARAGLEEDGEEGPRFEGDVEAIESVAGSIHAGEEVQDEVMN